MKYLEVATLREKLLNMVRTGAAMADVENALDECLDLVRAQAIEAHALSESDVIVVRKQPIEPEHHRAELIQLTAAALTGVLAGTQEPGVHSKRAAEFAVQCATDALDLINKK